MGQYLVLCTLAGIHPARDPQGRGGRLQGFRRSQAALAIDAVTGVRDWPGRQLLARN